MKRRLPMWALIALMLVSTTIIVLVLGHFLSGWGDQWADE